MPPVLVYIFFYIFFWLSTTFLCVIIVITYQKFYFCYLISSFNNFLQSIVLQFYGLFMLFVLNQFQNRGKKELLLFIPWSLSLVSYFNYYPIFLYIMAQIPNLLVCYWFVCILCFNELDVTRARHVSKIDYILVSVSHSIYWSTRLKPCPVANTKPRDILVIVCCLANQFLFLVIDW